MEVPASIQRHSFMSFSGNFHPLPYANSLFLFLSARRGICAFSFCRLPLNTLFGLHAAYVNEAFYYSPPIARIYAPSVSHTRILTHRNSVSDSNKHLRCQSAGNQLQDCQPTSVALGGDPYGHFHFYPQRNNWTAIHYTLA